MFHTESLPANTVAVMGVSAPASTSVTISDTLVGAWSTFVCNANASGGSAAAWVFVQPLGASPGTDTITINVGSSNTQPVQFDITFWQNISTSSPANGSLCAGNLTAGSGGLVTPGSFTPTANNDSNGGNLIWNYTPICSTNAMGNPSKWVAATGFTLLNGDIIWSNDQGFPEASQYYLQSAQASTSPSITATGDTADCFNSVSVALKVADNGASAPTKIHVAKIIHESYITFSSPGTQHVQFPTVGNLRVLATTWPSGAPGSGAGSLTGVSSSDGCSWAELNPGNGGAVMFYAQNCSPCATCTLSLTYSGGQTLPQASFRLYDVQNALASSFQNFVGNSGSCTDPTTTDAPSITPMGASSGLVIADNGIGTGPITGVSSPSGAVFDLWTFAGQSDSDLADNADGQAHYYFSSAAQQNYDWSEGEGNQDCYWIAAVFD
ncbi:MAG TPA: hypothetical protein VMU40_10075 [Steroidobacteraceae bacterium]|nr:hypothetical protein [Steroidobacteraceae bacterium]